MLEDVMDKVLQGIRALLTLAATIFVMDWAARKMKNRGRWQL